MGNRFSNSLVALCCPRYVSCTFFRVALRVIGEHVTYEAGIAPNLLPPAELVCLRPFLIAKIADFTASRVYLGCPMALAALPDTACLLAVPDVVLAQLRQIDWAYPQNHLV